MIDGSEKSNRQLAFELQNSHVCEKRGNKLAVFRDRKNASHAENTVKRQNLRSGLPKGAKGEEIQASQRQTSEKRWILSGGVLPCKSHIIMCRLIG